MNFLKRLKKSEDDLHGAKIKEQAGSVDEVKSPQMTNELIKRKKMLEDIEKYNIELDEESELSYIDDDGNVKQD